MQRKFGRFYRTRCIFLLFFFSLEEIESYALHCEVSQIFKSIMPVVSKYIFRRSLRITYNRIFLAYQIQISNAKERIGARIDHAFIVDIFKFYSGVFRRISDQILFDLFSVYLITGPSA